MPDARASRLRAAADHPAARTSRAGRRGRDHGPGSARSSIGRCSAPSRSSSPGRLTATRAGLHLDSLRSDSPRRQREPRHIQDPSYRSLHAFRGYPYSRCSQSAPRSDAAHCVFANVVDLDPEETNGFLSHRPSPLHLLTCKTLAPKAVTGRSRFRRSDGVQERG